MKQEMQTTTAAVSDIRVIRAGECPSLSGSSTLGYRVSCTPDGSIGLKIHSNTGAGYFSDEYIALTSILAAFGELKTVGGSTLRPLYQGKSSNNGGFLLAALLAEGLVQASSTQHGSYLPVDPAAYKASLRELIDAGIDLKVEEKPRKAEPIKPATPIKKARLTLSGIKA